MTRPAPCHPSRPYYAKGKCAACYQAEQVRAGKVTNSYSKSRLVRVPVAGWGFRT